MALGARRIPNIWRCGAPAPLTGCSFAAAKPPGSGLIRVVWPARAGDGRQ